MNKAVTSKKICIQFAISFFLLVAAFVLSLSLGAEKLPLKVFFGAGDKFQNIIFWNIRLPRSLLVLVTGILLGGSGTIFQMFFRNPLAEPGIMGISSGATLGAVCASVLGFGLGINITAFAGAILAGILVTSLAFSHSGQNSSIMLLLCGTALGTLYSAISSMLLLTCNKELHAIYSWILGSFGGRSWKELYFILLPAVISVIIMFKISRPLDLLTGGEKSAASLGVEVGRLRVLVLISGALAISCCVCAGGTIGFVGLIAPHIVRRFVGPKSRGLIPFSMIFGAIILLLSDTFARIIISPAELPAGIITSILGVPFFITLCLKKQN